MKTYRVPMMTEVDLYQVGHFKLIPPGMNDFQCSQNTFRKPLHYGGDENADHRLMSAGVRPFVENCLLDPMIEKDLEESSEFYSTFHATTTPPYYKPYPFDAKMFRRVIKEYGGYLPIKVTAMREGQAFYVGEPNIQVWTDVPGMGELVGWIESSLMPYLWTSSIVATRGRVRKDAWIRFVSRYYPNKTRDEIHAMILHKFVDFGRRGAASSQITGVAHLYNWLATDTADAAYVAQMYYNNRKPFGASSIMAAAHRTVTPWSSEARSMQNAVNQFGDGLLAFVADSYNYENGIRQLGTFAKVIKARGGWLIGRPDSGDVVETVIKGLEIFEEAFGATVDESGLKVLQFASILQGDGVSDKILFEKLLPAVVAAGYSPLCLSIGMGEYNHRAVRSDTEAGYKTCVVGKGSEEYPEFREFEPGYISVMKNSENNWKKSNPIFVGFNSKATRNRIYPITSHQLKSNDTGDLITVYDGITKPGEPYTNFELFEAVRERAWSSWEALAPVLGHDGFDPRIREMQKNYMAGINAM